MASVEVGARQTGAADLSAVLESAQRSLAAGRNDEAMTLLRAACDEGDAEALRFHAALAVRGVGRDQSFDDAVGFVERAAALGDAKAQGQLRALGGKIDRAVWQAPVALKQHHPAPRIYTIENFLPASACAWFIEYALQRMEPSTVRDGATGEDIVSPGRSATLAGSSALEADVVVQLAKLRIAEAIETHVSHQEPTTFLRYEPGQEYLAHYDLIRPQEEAAAAEELRTLGQRVATVLVYLNEGYEGGETYFPHLDWGFKGKAGDVLIFWNMSADGERERLSLHAGLSVTAGEKWLLSQWVRAKPVPLI